MIIRTLEFYGYGEQNAFTTVANASANYRVDVSDKEGNIITIEDGNKLLAMVGLKLDGGELSLLDAAHNNSVLATVEFPNAGELVGRPTYEDGVISFEIKTLNGETEKIEIDVEALVDIYEEGQGIEFKDGSEEGKKTINIKLAEGEDILKLDDNGLSISDNIATDAELQDAINSVRNALDEKADKDYVDNAVASAITAVDDFSDKIEEIENILGTDVSSPSISERIDILNGKVDDVSGSVESLEETVATFNGSLGDINEHLAVLDSTKLNKEDFTSYTAVTDQKIYALQAKDENLQSQISQEILDRQAADAAESQRATSAENSIRTALESEVTRATNAENEIRTLLNNTYTGVTSDISSLRASLETERGERVASDSQLQALIAAETSRATNAEGVLTNSFAQISGSFSVLQSAVAAETEERRNADRDLNQAINEEVRRATARENEIEAKITTAVTAEKNRAELAEANLNEKIDQEIARARAAEEAISGSYDDEIASLRRVDAQIRQEMHDMDNALRNRISNYEDDLSSEIDARISGDTLIKNQLDALDSELHEMVHAEMDRARDAEAILRDRIDDKVAEEKERAQNAERELADQLSSDYTWLSEKVTDNATKINMISELRNCETGVENYDDSGSGILDVLHREFHNFTGSTMPSAKGGITLNPDETTVGRYNISRREVDPATGGMIPSESTLFTVGFGPNESERQNAIEVRQDGKLWIFVEGELMCVNDLLGQIAHETY